MGPIEKAMSEDIDSIKDVTNKIKWILVCCTKPPVFRRLVGRLIRDLLRINEIQVLLLLLITSTNYSI